MAITTVTTMRSDTAAPHAWPSVGLAQTTLEMAWPGRVGVRVDFGWASVALIPAALRGRLAGWLSRYGGAMCGAAMPWVYAYCTACARSRQPVLVKIRLMCVLTVASLRKSSRAICRLV